MLRRWPPVLSGRWSPVVPLDLMDVRPIHLHATAFEGVQGGGDMPAGLLEYRQHHVFLPHHRRGWWGWPNQFNPGPQLLITWRNSVRPKSVPSMYSVGAWPGST